MLLPASTVGSLCSVTSLPCCCCMLCYMLLCYLHTFFYCVLYVLCCFSAFLLLHALLCVQHSMCTDCWGVGASYDSHRSCSFLMLLIYVPIPCALFCTFRCMIAYHLVFLSVKLLAIFFLVLHDVLLTYPITFRVLCFCFAIVRYLD
jgi:hypothetical protein